MIFISFGKWSTSSGRWFVRERYYFYGKWTPFVKVSIKGLRLISDMASGGVVLPKVDSLDESINMHETYLPGDIVERLKKALPPTSNIVINVSAIDVEGTAQFFNKNKDLITQIIKDSHDKGLLR